MMEILNQISENFEVSVTEHYALDLVATILLFVATYLLGQKKKSGFVLNAIASVLWVIWHFKWGSMFGAFMNIGLFLLCVHSLYQWDKK